MKKMPIPWLEEGVTQVETPHFDSSGTELINSSNVPLDQVNEMIRSGAISHSLVITAFHFLSIERPDLVFGDGSRLDSNQSR